MSEVAELLSTGAVAVRVGLPRWRFQYLLERGTLPGPTLCVAGRRLFTPADVQRITAILIDRPGLRGGPKATNDTAVEGR